MTDPVTITLKAVVDASERAAVTRAAALLENSLGAAAAGPVRVQCQFEASLSALKSLGDPCVIITSLLPEVANHDQSWTDVSNRLWASYRELTASDAATVFVCTVFRHVPAEESDAGSRLVRIRRLNLLAAELSRITGLFVIDLDRSLADIGALRIQTDYRLRGEYASHAVAREIAIAIASTGLEAYLPFEVCDAAKLAITQDQPSIAAIKATAPDVVLSNVFSFGTGRRKQLVATVVDTNTESQASRLIHLVLTGQFSLRDALSKMSGSIAHRGVRASFTMVVGAILQTLKRRSEMGR